MKKVKHQSTKAREPITAQRGHARAVPMTLVVWCLAMLWYQDVKRILHVLISGTCITLSCPTIRKHTLWSSGQGEETFPAPQSILGDGWCEWWNKPFHIKPPLLACSLPSLSRFTESLFRTAGDNYFQAFCLHTQVFFCVTCIMI